MFRVLLAVLILPGAGQDPGIDDAERLVLQLGSEDVGRRSEAVEALKKSGSKALGPLEKAARSSDPELAARARELVGWIRVDAVLPPSVKRAVSDAADRLNRGGERAWTELVMELLTASQGLRAKGEPVTRNHLLSLREALSREPSGAVKASDVTIQDMAVLVAPALKGSRGDQERAVLCMAAARSLSASAVTELRGLLKDESGLVRGEAAKSLAALGDKAAIPDMVSLLSDKDPRARHDALLALSKLGSREALPSLARLFHDEEQAIRLLAVQMVFDLKAREVLPELLKCGEDSIIGPFLDSPAAWKALGGAELLPDLRALLKAEDPAVRKAVERAIRIIQPLDPERK